MFVQNEYSLTSEGKVRNMPHRPWNHFLHHPYPPLTVEHPVFISFKGLKLTWELQNLSFILCDTEFFRTPERSVHRTTSSLPVMAYAFTPPPCPATCLTPACTQQMGLELKRCRIGSCIQFWGAEILRWSLGLCGPAVLPIRTYPLWLLW